MPLSATLFPDTDGLDGWIEASMPWLGAWLVVHTSAAATLSVAAGVMAIVTAGTALAARRPATWRQSQP